MRTRLSRYSQSNYSLKGKPCLILFLLFCSPVLGQISNSELQVRVVDANDQAVAGATVTLTNKLTGRSVTATTSETGLAVFVNVAPGEYDISAEHFGFMRATRQHVQSDLKQAEPVDLRLGEPSASMIDISVRGSAREELPEQISALPNLNNDLTPLLQVVAGSVATGPAALGRVIIDGKGNDQQTVRLDGTDFTVMSELPTADPAIDTVSSFQKPEVAGDLDKPNAKARAFPVQFGPGTGSVTDVSTYRGVADGWKAQFYGDYRNEAFNARNFFDFDGKNALRRGRFGGKVGGPLDERKSVLPFLAFDSIFGRIERNVYEAIPVDANCDCGPLAETMRGFLPPGTTLVPGASLDPNFLVARRRNRTTVESYAGDVRLDYLPFAGAKAADGKAALKSNDILTLRFIHQTARNDVPDGVTGRRQRQLVTFNNALASFSWIPKESVIHTIRFGFNQTRAHVATDIGLTSERSLSESLITIGGSVKTIGLPGQIVIAGQDPTIPIATLGGLVKNVGRGFTLNPKSYSLAFDSLLPVGERAELRFGVETRMIRMDFDRLGGLTYTFPSVAALRTGTPGKVTFLSDLSRSSPFSKGAGLRQARQEYYMGYFQTTLPIGEPENDPTSGKQASRLTFIFGLRYDYFSATRERNNRAVIVDPLTGAFLPAGTPFYRTEKLNLQPRFSLSYRLANEGFFQNTVFRAGVGVYSGVPRIGDLLLPIESDRFSTGITEGTFPSTPSDVVSGFLANPQTRRFQPLAFSRKFTALERLVKWEVQLTQTIRGYDLGVLYTGNVGMNLPLANIANRIRSVTTNPDPTQPAIISRDFDATGSGLDEFFFRQGNGHSSYNGLTISFGRNTNATAPEKPSSWLRQAVGALNVQYIFSHNKGNVSGTVASNPFNLESDYGFNAADLRHNLKVSAVYDLWRASDETRDDPTNLLMGWKIMPSIKASSGFPLIIRLNRPDLVYVDAAGNIFATPAVGRTVILNTGGGENGGAWVPDRIPGVDPYLRNAIDIKNGIQYLNPAAFSIPAPGTFGNLKRGELRGPSIFLFDLGLRRNLFRSEIKKISGQFQIDFFNLLNRANFINPSATLPGVLGTNADQLQPRVPFSRTTAGSFGIITAADSGRQIQFSFTLRLNDGFTQ